MLTCPMSTAALIYMTTTVCPRPSVMDSCLMLLYPADRQSSSPLPDFVANTHPEEPSHPPPSGSPVAGPARKLVKRAASRLPSPPPEKLDEEVIEMPPPRKVSHYIYPID
jgi:hypothetical protein